MLVNDYALRARDWRVNEVDAKNIENTLTSFGYFAEANIIPPFFDVHIAETDKVSKTTRKPLTHFVTKSSEQWRDFKIVNPENYMHTVKLLVKNYASIQKILTTSQSIYSYSNPNVYSSQAGRSGNQISAWHEMQGELLSSSGKYRLPVLVQIDIQSCFHTLYTHSIEWALNSIGKKSLGSQLDESIRRGNTNRTHGLPVGPSTSDIVSEIVLNWVDTSIEAELAEIDCTATRFKDNYYFLCKSESDAHTILSRAAIVLRSAHFTINDSKTVISKFSDYYSSRWQAEYDLLLEGLQLDDREPIFTNRKLKVFVEQLVILSKKYKNQKSILDKGVALLTRGKFLGYINYEWLFYAISNMLPLRSFSYPKILAFMKKMAEDNTWVLNDIYNSFMENEINSASERSDTFALLWLAYVLYDSKQESLKNLVLDKLSKFSKDDPLVEESLRYMTNSPSSYVLWKDNSSKIQFKYKEYLSTSDLIEFLGISFGES